MIRVPTEHRRPCVLYVLTSGISARFLRGQLAFLVEAGYEIHVAANHAELDVAYDEGVVVHDIAFRRAPAPVHDLFALLRTVRLIRSVRPSIVNASTPKAGLLGMVAARICRVPRRVHVVRGLRHATLRGMSRRIHRGLAQLTIRLSTDVVFNSPSLRDWAEDDGIIDRGLGLLLGRGSGNGIDIERFQSGMPRSEARRQLDLPEHDEVIGYVGRLTRDKGVPELLRAFSAVSEERDHVHLVLIGQFESGDPVHNDVRSEIDRSPTIHVRPWVDDPANIYPALDVLAFPSLREGLPNTVLEAQAASVPVVAFDAVGTRDALAPTSDRWLIPLGDVPGFARALQWTLAHRAEAAELSASSANWVSSEFAQQRVWGDLLGLYETHGSTTQ